MEIRTCSFVEVTDIFAGCPDAWQMFIDSDPPVSWGDANRTLVSPEFMTFMLEDCFSDDNQIARQIDLVLYKVKNLDCTTYIDLEN
jgi:hypothetical protein